MTENELKFAIKVIKQAKKLGVQSMKLGTLEFVFKNTETPRARPPLKVSKKQIALDEKNNTDQLQLNEALDELSTMHVEDPAAYERALVENDLFEDDIGGGTIEETQSQ